jgi:hypothetical protein
VFETTVVPYLVKSKLIIGNMESLKQRQFTDECHRDVCSFMSGSHAFKKRVCGFWLLTLMPGNSAGRSITALHCRYRCIYRTPSGSEVVHAKDSNLSDISEADAIFTTSVALYISLPEPTTLPPSFLFYWVAGVKSRLPARTNKMIQDERNRRGKFWQLNCRRCSDVIDIPYLHRITWCATLFIIRIERDSTLISRSKIWRCFV